MELFGCKSVRRQGSFDVKNAITRFLHLHREVGQCEIASPRLRSKTLYDREFQSWDVCANVIIELIKQILPVGIRRGDERAQNEIFQCGAVAVLQSRNALKALQFLSQYRFVVLRRSYTKRKVIRGQVPNTVTVDVHDEKGGVASES